MTEYKLPEPVVQEFFRFIARSSVGDELNTFFKFMAVNSIFVSEARKDVKRQLGENWPRYYRKYKKAHQLVNDMKYYHDALRSRDVYRDDQNHPLSKKAKAAYHRIPLFMPEVNEIYIMLLRLYPELHNQRVPSEYYQKEKSRKSSFSDYSHESTGEYQE